MDNVMSFGWAVDTYHAQLGARLEAYVATKAALTTLRVSIRHSATSSMRQTSPEITEMISNALKDSVYNDLIGRWNHESKCIRDIFSHDTGVTPYTTVQQHHWDPEAEVPCKKAEISAYLSIPLVTVPIKSEPLPGFASFSINHVIDLTAIVQQGVTDEIRKKLHDAIMMLRLNQPHSMTTKKELSGTNYYARDGEDEAETDEEEDGNNRGGGSSRGRSSNPQEVCLWCDRVPPDPLSTERKSYCVDCDADDCQGWIQTVDPEPKLMALGSGLLHAQ
ncbi:MAG: hypothetical protein Q9202_007189 [Teloschistes flavicans]